MSFPARILVVEDDSDLRKSLAEVLEDEGCEVACARDGLEALRHLEASEAPQAILLDLTMAGMDGWTFRARQRSDPRLARIPTVVISAAYAADPSGVAALAADAFLPKPFDLGSLLEALKRIC
ncbi:MAG TPA: response regulator [Anaeromyxobacter sp.]|nr:response regulator [Anaeromyxobacter sp.]